MAVFEAHPLLNHRSANSWNIDARSKSGGVNLDGDEQIISSPVGRWRAEIRLGLLSPAKRRELVSYLSRLRGRANAVRLRPACCPSSSLFTRLGMAVPTASQRSVGLPHEDDSLFSDGIGYAISLPPMVLAAPAPAFASDLLLDEGVCARGLAAGDYLGLAGRLFRVVAVFPGEAVYRVSVEPPLRVSALAGAAVDLNPTAVMRLADDRGGFVGLDYAAPPEVTLTFVEKPEPV